MNFFVNFTLISIFLLCAQVSHSKGVYGGDDGMHWEEYDSTGSTEIVYQVDTVAQICFAIYVYSPGAGVTEISCDKLAKRPEWKTIINWVSNE